MQKFKVGDVISFSNESPFKIEKIVKVFDSGSRCYCYGTFLKPNAFNRHHYILYGNDHAKFVLLSKCYINQPQSLKETYGKIYDR